jgi:hypothetical protein
MKKQQIIVPIFLFATCVALFIQCKNPQNANLQASGDTTEAMVGLPAGFEVFYQKFHQDSAYQMAHITWPLQGSKGMQIDSVTNEIRPQTWQPSEWRMQKLDLIESGEYIREMNPIGDMMVIERIRAKAVPFGIERRFAKQANQEWELIYYMDIFEFK